MGICGRASSNAVGDRELWRHDPAKEYFDSERGINRQDVDIVQLLMGFFRLCSWTPGGFTLVANFAADMDSAEASETFGPLDGLIPRWSTLRHAFAQDLKRMYDSILPVATCIFGCRSLWREDFRDIVLGTAERRDESAYHGILWELLEVVVKLDSLSPQENLGSGIDEVRGCLQAPQTRKLLVKMIRRAASIDDPSIFIETEGQPGFTSMSIFTFDKLRACALRLRDISESLVAESSSKMVGHMDDILDNILKARPVAWPGMVVNVDPIFLALKYQALEDLPATFAAFRKANADAPNKPADFDSLLTHVSEVYRNPLVNTKDLDLLSETLDLRDRILSGEAEAPMADVIVWQRTGAPQVAFTPDDWRVILEIAVAQMDNMRSKLKIYLQPHHTQMVTVLMFSFLVNAIEKGESDGYKAVIAEVGTGEGKSWIIAMIAAYAAKKGYRVHILVDNAALRLRDFEMMREFYELLGLHAVDCTDHQHALLEKSSRIVYFSSHDLDYSVRKLVLDGAGPNFADAVLLVDECDGLIIDGNANTHWLGGKDEVKDMTNHWLKIWKETGSLSTIPEADMDEFTRRSFRRVKEACQKAKKKQQGVDYEVIGGKVYYLDPITKTPTPTLPLWLEILRCEKNPKYEITSTHAMTVTSHATTHLSYARLFGLTGSLGGQAERNFVMREYKATSFAVPSFLDTCPRAGGKRRPVLQAGDYMVQSSEEDVIKRVVQVAAAKCMEVPVLIIAENPQARQRFIEALRRCPELPDEYRGEDSRGVLQIGGEGPQCGDDIVRKVELATKAVQVLSSSSNSRKRKWWPISVGGPESGRGHDYRVFDANVDKNGGFLVILTFVPLSIRDWIQFRGRTARQDRHGQYAVIVNTSTHPDLALQQGQGVRGEEMISMILNSMDAKKAKELDGKHADIEKGAAMMELSRRYRQIQKDAPLSTAQVHNWCVLCEDFYDKSVADIHAFWDKHIGLVSSR